MDYADAGVEAIWSLPQAKVGTMDNDLQTYELFFIDLRYVGGVGDLYTPIVMY